MILEVKSLDENKEVLSTEKHEVEKGKPIDIDIESNSPNPKVEGTWCGLEYKTTETGVKIYGTIPENSHYQRCFLNVIE